jgi:transcriptional regulator with XRE-family HTH domain
VPSSLRLYQVLGETIRSERTKAGLSQERLAEKASLTRNYIGQTERGEKRITIEALAAIARAMRLRVSDLTRNI